jgi:hypothetical protein
MYFRLHSSRISANQAEALEQTISVTEFGLPGAPTNLLHFCPHVRNHARTNACQWFGFMAYLASLVHPPQ